MRATRVGKDTVLAQIADLVSRAQNSKAPRQRLADKAAAILVVVAVSAGVLTFAGWSLLASPSFRTALTSTPGLVSALVGGTLNLAGWWWMKRVVAKAAL